MEIASCTDQIEMDTAFENWLTQFTHEGGCNAEATDLSNFTAPNFCGGTVEITYTANDDCGQIAECTSTFTVLAAPELTVNCPMDMEIASCTDQIEIDTAFENWLTQFTHEGGCNTLATNLSNFTAPNFCGGTVEITYTANDDCGQTSECSSIFTVASAPQLSVSCPGNEILNACQTQEDVDIAFGLWIAQFDYSGGCGAMATNLAGFTAPPASGGNVVIDYLATDLCNQSASCTAIFEVLSSTEINITCPQDVQIEACTDQIDINAAFAEWIQEFSFTGGCNATATDLSGFTVPDICGGNLTIYFEVTDIYNQYAGCSSTFTIDSVPPLSVSCPLSTEMSACLTQAEIESAFENWLGQFTYNGGCNTEASDLGNYSAPNFCGGTLEILYQATDACGQSAECTSTFTVLAAPELTVNCPMNMEIASCTDQATIDPDFENWLTQFTHEGGCNTVATNLSNFTAPNFCGGTVEITYTANDDCGQIAECTSTFTVLTAPELMVNCPMDMEIASCTDQTDINATFENWLTQFTYTGGCNASVTDLNIYNAPIFCGGTVEITYTANDDCGQSAECTSTFMVLAAPELTITCPMDMEIASCTDQIEIDTAFENWLTQFTHEGGCNTEASDLGNYYAPNFCGGTVEILYQANDACGQTAECTSTFTVLAAPELTVTCPMNMEIASCTDQATIETDFENWLTQFTHEGGCNTDATDLSNLTAPNFCSGTVEITYTANDDCGQMAECTSTFTVLAAPELTVTCPMDMEIASCTDQIEIDTAFENWLTQFTHEGGCNTVATNLSNFTAPNFCGGETTITYEATDACGQSAECASTFGVLLAPELTVTCPMDMEMAACSDQTEVDTEFANWINQFAYTGGCNAIATDLSSYTAPNFCSGETTITYEATDACGQIAECTSSFMVMAASELSVICPQTVTIPPCTSQAEVDAAFNLWISEFGFTGGCQTESTDLTGYLPPDTLGSTVTIIYNVTDLCGQQETCTSSFTVLPAPDINFSCPEGFSLCCDSEPVDLFQLSGINPLGGIFDGNGVVDSKFTPDCSNTGNFEITYSYTEPQTGCIYSCSFIITVSPIPQAFAGNNDTIYSGETYELSFATENNSSALIWETSGDGQFNDPDSLHPVYTPGTNDKVDGSVQLCLTAFAYEGCEDITSCMTLTIDPDPTPEVVVNPDCLKLTLLPNETFNRIIKINNKGYGDLNYDIEEDATWLSVDSISGVIPGFSLQVVNVQFDSQGLGFGEYLSEILITTNDPENPAITIPVSLNIVDSIAGQRIHVVEGWSIISSYIDPTEPQLESIFENQLECSTLIFMLGKEGIFWPSQSINTIGDWNPYKGYKVKMSVDDQLIFYGEPIGNKSVQLEIPEGLSYMPMLSRCPVQAQDVFSDIEDNLVYVFDIQDQLVYWPEGGLFTLHTLIPGRGYVIFLTEAATITFPDCPKQQTNYQIQKTNEPLLFNFNKTGFQHIISINMNVWSGFSEGDIIAAFDNENNCVGYAPINSLDENVGLILYGDDYLTPVKDGMLEGESINLRLIKAETNEAINLYFQFDQTLPDHLPVYVENGLSRILKISSSETGILNSSEDYSPMIYPNPAKDVLHIDLGTDVSAQLQILNMRGQVIGDQELKQAQNTINISHLTKGIYFIKIENDLQQITRKLVVQ
ncbi:MAG: T9SS type A sorting domain-containing protein [Bacteroidales bacterium]|nr:T9SS type A sorting domain-containing protein [Bacteroidales bacterium]